MSEWKEVHKIDIGHARIVIQRLGEITPQYSYSICSVFERDGGEREGKYVKAKISGQGTVKIDRALEQALLQAHDWIEQDANRIEEQRVQRAHERKYETVRSDSTRGNTRDKKRSGGERPN